MSTNAYHANETIEYGGIGDKTYWGYALSTTSCHETVHPFESREEREHFERCISSAGEFREEDGWALDVACAALALRYMGDESQNYLGDETVDYVFNNEADGLAEKYKDAVNEAAEAFFHEREVPRGKAS
jgi:hypothetical protein